MPGPRPKSAGSKGGKKKRAGAKNRLPPRPDLRNYGTNRGVQAKPGWYTAASLDDQIDTCVTKLVHTSPLNQRNEVPRGLLLGALASPRFAIRSGHSNSSCQDGRNSTSPGFQGATLGAGNRSEGARQVYAGPPVSCKTLGRLESKTRAGNAIKAAATSNAMMVLDGAGSSAPPRPQCSPDSEKGSLPLGVSITHNDVKASNITNDPRFLEMSEALATYEDGMREATESPALGCAKTVQPPPSPSITKIEGQWIPKDCSKEGQNGIRRGYLAPMEGLEPLVWARTPARYCQWQSHYHHEETGEAPDEFLNPSSYELSPGVSLPADDRRKRSSFFQELECRLREMLTSGDTFFRLSQLDAVYEWFSREQGLAVGTCEENNNMNTEPGKTTMPSHPADYPPTQPPPDLPFSSGAFDAVALAGCRGSAFYDPSLLLLADSFDSLGTSETIDPSFGQKNRFSSSTCQKFSASSSTSSGWISSASSSGIGNTRFAGATEPPGKTKLRQLLPASHGKKQNQASEYTPSSQRPSAIWADQPCRRLSSHGGAKSNFLTLVQDHAPRITPSDHLLEMETRCLLPPQTDNIITMRREQMLSKKKKPLFTPVTALENARSCWGDNSGEWSANKGGKAATHTQPPVLPPVSHDRSAKTSTTRRETDDNGQWAQRCSERCKGNLQQRYLRDPRSLRPPWGMRNIHLTGSPRDTDGFVTPSGGSPRQKFEKAGAPPRYTFAGEPTEGVPSHQGVNFSPERLVQFIPETKIKGSEKGTSLYAT